jgi:hypothetical protein
MGYFAQPKFTFTCYMDKLTMGFSDLFFEIHLMAVKSGKEVPEGSNYIISFISRSITKGITY